MTATLSGSRLELKSPRRHEVKLGDEVDVVVDLEVADPWIELPEVGRKIGSVDGHAQTATLAFECDGHASIPSLIAGSASVKDTKIDVHTPAGFPDAGAGRGVEVVVRGGAVELRYGHLERGTTRAGSIRAGQEIGRAGNTGRCVDGCGRNFFTLEVIGGRQARTLEQLAEPIDLEAVLEGKSIGKVRFPAGELKATQLKVGRGRAPRDRAGKKAFQLEVRVSRGGKVFLSESIELAIRL